jgi:hypothetical protein
MELVTAELKVAVVVAQGQFRNLGRGKFAVESWYQRTCE